ncbi:hypothetical protein, partial [Streptomyces scabiei]|uniref:hypothetical protein n=1 Tax=Streptomyces scabiei TaxID=1930 RepID=UPI0038F6C5CF
NMTTRQALDLGNSPLSRVLPTESTGELLAGNFVPALSEAGKRHPVTSTLGDSVPSTLWSPWYRQIDGRVKSDNSEVLMTG